MGGVDVEAGEGVVGGGGAGVGSRVEAGAVVGRSRAVRWGVRLGRSECEERCRAWWLLRRLGGAACVGSGGTAIHCGKLAVATYTMCLRP